MNLSVIRNIALVVSLLFSGVSQAALWNVNTVLSGGDGGFGFSSLHKANDSSPMSGSKLVNIISASGTYDDTSGAANFVLGLDNMDTLTLSGILMFDGSGSLSSNSQLAYSGLTNLAASAFGVANSLGDSGSFGYLPGDVCCGGDYDPNSFLQDIGGGSLQYLTLWGADYGGGIFGGDYMGSIIGMDLRLELSQVPIPAAIYLFGTALFGLIGLRRRKVATSAG